MEATTNDSSAACGQSVLTDGLERLASDCGGRLMPGTNETEGFVFSKRDLAGFVDAIAKRERKACAERAADAVDAELETGDGESLREHVRNAVMRSNMEFDGGLPRKDAELAANKEAMRWMVSQLVEAIAGQPSMEYRRAWINEVRQQWGPPCADTVTELLRARGLWPK